MAQVRSCDDFAACCDLKPRLDGVCADSSAVGSIVAVTERPVVVTSRVNASVPSTVMWIVFVPSPVGVRRTVSTLDPWKARVPRFHARS